MQYNIFLWFKLILDTSLEYFKTKIIKKNKPKKKGLSAKEKKMYLNHLHSPSKKQKKKKDKCLFSFISEVRIYSKWRKGVPVINRIN